MTGRARTLILAACLVISCVALALAQAPPPDGGSNWRAPGASPASAPAAAPGSLQPAASAPRGTIAKVTSGSGTLPNAGGQVWREYEITPYTLRVTSTNPPEQAIVAWILRDTGYE